MNKIKKGSIVVRKSYGKDIEFIVNNILNTNKEELFILKGIIKRIEADSYIEDLEIVDKKYIKKIYDDFESRIETEIINFKKLIELEESNYRGNIQNNSNKYIEKYLKSNFNINFNKEKNEKINIKINNKKDLEKNKDKRINKKYITGKILHLDGDKKYSEKSFRYYKKLGLNAIVRNIPEYKQPDIVYKLLNIYNPDILVITGHDAMIKDKTRFRDIYNYRNSIHFVNSVKKARMYEYEKNKDLVIFAGACQSYFEAIMEAGANFASSPARILIDFMDPLIVSRKDCIY